MKLTKVFLAIALSFSLSIFSFLILPVQTINAQDAKIALQRGYRTGYSDGYMAGYRDSIENSAKNYSKHNEYGKADRAFSKDYGKLEEYRDGYQQGFETGYDTGFDKHAFDATLPETLNKRGVSAVVVTPEKSVDNSANNNSNNTAAQNQPPVNNNYPANPPPVMKNNPVEAQYQNDSGAIVVIPTDTELILELSDEVGTQRSREGDKFTARVVSPAEISGALIEGRVSKIIKPGRIKRRSQMLLSFDRIILTQERWSNFNAVLTEILPIKGDNVKLVDTEGTAIGKSSLKDDSIKVGAATGTGLVIGAVAGGPAGAAIGAGVGAAFGVGAIVIERGKDIRLNKSQQLRIKTSYETQIR